ncbi:hypothetical protein RUM43_009154 [Polyplax serrata]|uniref:Uncharacterized protein n=1 Tax=Polyplax serrata TaxID=468196 RepID=A0AAN8PCA8_POLSC
MDMLHRTYNLDESGQLDRTYASYHTKYSVYAIPCLSKSRTPHVVSRYRYHWYTRPNTHKPQPLYGNFLSSDNGSSGEVGTAVLVATTVAKQDKGRRQQKRDFKRGQEEDGALVLQTWKLGSNEKET